MPRHDACHAGYEWLIAAMVASKRQPGKMVQALAMMKPKEEAVVEEEASAEGVEVEEEALFVDEAKGEVASAVDEKEAKKKKKEEKAALKQLKEMDRMSKKR